MANKLTKNDIDKILPQLEKEQAIEQAEKFKKEFEDSQKLFEDLVKKLSEPYEDKK